MQNKYNCSNCEALFTVKHNLDEAYYEVIFCPFCGAEIEEEQEDGLEDEE